MKKNINEPAGLNVSKTTKLHPPIDNVLIDNIDHDLTIISDQLKSMDDKLSLLHIDCCKLRNEYVAMNKSIDLVISKLAYVHEDTFFAKVALAVIGVLIIVNTTLLYLITTY